MSILTTRDIHLMCQYGLIRHVLSIAWILGGLGAFETEAQVSGLQEEKRIQRVEQAQEKAQQLVVMIEGQLGEGPTMGTGIIFGREGSGIYIATANHVVRKGSFEAQNLRIRLRSSPDQFIKAVLLEHVDQELDLAVLSVKDLRTYGIDVCVLPFDHLGKTAALKRGDEVYPLGNPNGVPWGMPVVPDRVAQIVGEDVAFQSTFISIGHSGGALLNGDMNLVGMITKDAPPFGLATPLDKILRVLRQWGYPVHLQFFRQDGITPLHTAAGSGDLSAVKHLIIDECVDVNVGSAGGTPLFQAIRSEQVEIVKLLLEAGADVKDDKTGKSTPLLAAIHSGQVEIVMLLLEAGADANGIFGVSTPLLTAVDSRQVEIVKLLLEAGADANGAIFRRRTPLAAAVRKSDVEIAKILLEEGASVNKRNARGYSPMHVAIGSGQPEMVKFLLQSGANLNDPWDDGTTVLHLAASRGQVKIMKMLLDAGMTVNAKNKREETPLHWSTESPDPESVKLLLNAGAEVNSTDHQGCTPLHYAATLMVPAAVKILLNAGVAVNATDVEGDTALHRTIEAIGMRDNYVFPETWGEANPIATLEVLLQAGANVNAKNKKYTDPLDRLNWWYGVSRNFEHNKRFNPGDHRYLEELIKILNSYKSNTKNRQPAIPGESRK